MKSKTTATVVVGGKKYVLAASDARWIQERIDKLFRIQREIEQTLHQDEGSDPMFTFKAIGGIS